MNDEHDRIEALLNQALEFKPEERVAFLAGACGGDHDLRQKVETLLASNDEASGFMPDNSTLMEGAILSEGPGTVIDRYKLLQQIGEGGMGVVYMAQQEVPVKRKIALKIIKLGMDTKNVVARFEAERQALAMMDHPNIARVLDGGATETGRPYFVMELVQGVPITEFCDKNKLSATERLELFMPVCQAIQSAHQKGIIHRDIKPSNVLVTLHHGEPMPKVIDFGIAKATNQKLTEKTLFTNYAQMIGTPAYMSPEQAEMSSMDVDTRTDVYSLGVLLYELLTGTTPFSSKRLSSMAYGEMQRVIAEEEPQKPSTRMSTMEVEKKTVTAKNRGIDVAVLSKQFKGDIDWIVMKCLEKDRRRRYDTPKELVADLKRFLNNEPVSAAAPSISYQFQKLAKRYKAAFAAAAAIAAIFIIGSTVATWQAIRATRLQREADTARATTEDALNEQKTLSLSLEEAMRELEVAKEDVTRKLYRSSLDQAEIALVRNEPGFRTKTETLLKEASSLDTDVRDELEMRNAAMAVIMVPYSDEGEVVYRGPWREDPELSLFSPVYHEIARVFTDESMVIGQLGSGETLAVLNTDFKPVQSIAFARDGNALLSAHEGGIVRVWRRSAPSDWSMIRELRVNTDGAPIEIDAGESGFVALISGSNILRHWKDLSAHEPEIHMLPEEYQTKELNWRAVSISPDERWAVIQMLKSKKIVVLDLVNRRITETPSIGALKGELNTWMQFSPDGKYLAMGGPGLFQLYRSGTFELQFEKADSSGLFGGNYDFSPDSSQVIYGQNPATIHLLGANQPLVTPAVQQGRFAFSRTSKELLHGIRSGLDQFIIQRWPHVSREFVELIGHEKPVKGITFHPTEPLVVTSSVDETVRFWNLDDGTEVQRITTPKAASSEDPVFSPDGRIFVTALEDEVGTVQIRDARSTQIIHEFELGARTYFVDFSKDGKLLAISGIGVVKAWKYETPLPLSAPNSIQLTKIMEVNNPELGALTTVRFSRDSQYMAWFEAGPDNPRGLGTESSGIRVWDLKDNRALPYLIKTFNAWNSFDFIGHDNLMAIAGLEGGIELWNFVTGEKVSQLPGYGGNSEQVDVSNDGRYLAFFERLSGVGVFDLETNQLLFMSPPLAAPAWHVNWNQDGTLLGIAEENGQARVLNITAIRSQLAELGLDW